MLERLENEAAKVGLKINVKKSKKIRIAMNNNGTLHIYSETIERVPQFAHLGSINDNAGGAEGDIAARIRKAQIAFSALKQHLAPDGIFNANQTSNLQYKGETSPTLRL